MLLIDDMAKLVLVIVLIRQQQNLYPFLCFTVLIKNKLIDYKTYIKIKISFI